MNEIQIQLIGRVSSLPEQIGKNGSYKFSIALDFKKDPETREFIPIFINILVFTTTAEKYKNFIPLLSKGSKLFISGTICDLHCYMSKANGEHKAQITVSASNMSFVSSGISQKSGDSNSDNNSQRNYSNNVVKSSSKRSYVAIKEPNF